MVLDPTRSTAYEAVPLYDSGNPQHRPKVKPFQRFRRPLRALEGFPFIPNSKPPPVLRLVTFLLLEAGFLALSIVCLLKPIPLPIPNNDTILREAKAATTAIAIVWHSLAIFMAQDLTVWVFSAECMAQYRLTGKLRPGETDRVSAIHTGLFSRMKHFVSPVATPRYRVAFAAAVILMVLAPIGPSVLSIGSAPVQSLEEIQLSNLTIRGALQPISGGYEEDLVSEQAEFILRMETRENETFGFGTANESVLIPWPQWDLKYNQEETITYWTDVAIYDYECSWNPPVLNKPQFTMNDSLTQIMEAGGIPWKVRLSESMPRSLPFECGGDLVIMPLVNTATLGSPGNDSSVSGFIFLWSSFSMEIVSYAKNLSFRSTDTNTEAPGIPSTNLTSSTYYKFAPHGLCYITGSQASILLCDPHLHVLPGEVRLEGGKLYLNRLADKSLRIGNIPDYAANGMVAQALVSAVQPSPYYVPSDDAAALFLTPKKDKFMPSPEEYILPLKEINHNMNAYIQIAAKAYLSGAFADNLPVHLRRWTTQNGTRIRQKPALASSKPFLLALTAIVASLAVLLSCLHVMVPYQDMQLFDLHNFTIREKHEV